MANTPQSYTTKFRSLQPEKLAEIIVGEQDYHPDAVEAARLELTARMLPMEELDRIYDLAEEKKIKSGSDGTQLGLGENPRVDAFRKTIKDKAKTAIWTRTNILKLILGFLIYSFLYSLYNIASWQLGSFITYDTESILNLAVSLIDPLILLVIIVVGIKGYKIAWWAVCILFTLGLLLRITNAYNTYQYYKEFEDEDPTGLSAMLAEYVYDPYTAAFNLFVASIFLYLILRKDTRVAAGISKGANRAPLEELDHLI